MSRIKSALSAAALAVVSLGAHGPAVAEDGVTDAAVTFAQVAAFEGPAAALGTGMRHGILAAFAEVNAAGGVHGRELRLVSENDGYEPEISAAAVKRIIAGREAFAFIGPVGTPTSKATQPLAAEAAMPFIAPFTGAGFLRQTDRANVVNLRASYAAETEAWIAHLVDERGFDNIAILFQDDAFGRVGLNGVTAALDKRGLTLSAQGSYTRNTTAVKTALLEIRRAEPQAVVMVGAYPPVAEFIRLSRKLRMDPAFVTISFVGSRALAQELGPDGAGVIISQVVPFPWDDSLPVVASYQAALTAHDPSLAPDFVSLEGYLAGRLAALALAAAGPAPTRAAFLDAVTAMTEVDLGGATLRFGPGDNQGLEAVFLSRITADGGFEPVSRSGS
ncbi:MAG: ABC transporter substrate-binding protein [Pseudomonadota bacterium]